VEEHTRPGIVTVDDAGGQGHGHVGIVMANSRRRVGQEGERVHIATLYANVTEEASETREITPRFEDFGGFSRRAPRRKT
jgi:crotonobetainyl-CoA:carnitine CoA-transferase CaiB-like acyl-CoA transferase